jgi:putative membrane protein
MHPTREHSGVSGTVDAFNFIRRVGFPQTPEVISGFSTIAVLSGLLSLPSSGLTLGTSFFVSLSIIVVPTIVGEFLNATVLLRGDPVLNFRRLMGMELISWFTLTPLLPFTSLVGATVGNRTLWIDGFLVALIISLPVRFLTVFAMSTKSALRKLIAALLVPSASFRIYAGAVTYLSLQTLSQILPSIAAFLASAFLSGVGVVFIIRGVEKKGSPKIGDSPMGLFRDFLRHWLKKEAEPLERRLRALGTKGEIKVSVLAFKGLEKSKACIAVSNFHPGPYRDLGSGGLPSTLKASIESATKGVALVPHGISNHEYNIISQEDIQALLRETNKNYPASPIDMQASPFVRETVGEAKASAQIFGNAVFITLTLAPRDMEDIPTQVLEKVEEFAESKRLHAVVADAHNSLKQQTAVTPEQASMLTDAAIKALERAYGMPRSRFKIGAASDSLAMFGVEEGIGPGGLSLVTVECQNQHAAYLTIDGNNMEAGFRDSILSQIRDQGIDDGEVMTTDTHLVAGIVRSALGYHPVGENMNKEAFLARVRENLESARSNEEDATTGFAELYLDLHVLGSSTFENITSFVGLIARKIGSSFMRLELAVFAVTVLLLAVL